MTARRSLSRAAGTHGRKARQGTVWRWERPSARQPRGAKGVGAKPEAAGWRLAVVGVRPALLGKEVARPAERGVGRLPCGSSPPNGDTRMARRCPWSLQWRRDSCQAAPLGQGHGWSRGRYSLVDVSRFMPLRWARLDDSTGSSRGARGVLFRAK